MFFDIKFLKPYGNLFLNKKILRLVRFIGEVYIWIDQSGLYSKKCIFINFLLF